MKKTTDVTFTRTAYGIEIVFGKDKTFFSCVKGDDLSDLDEMLMTFLPDINMELISYSKARSLEKKLYCMLSVCKQQRTLKKALFDFLNYTEKRYCKKSSSNPESSAKMVMLNIKKLTLKRIASVSKENNILKVVSISKQKILTVI